MIMDVRITAPRTSKGKRGKLLSLIGNNTPNNPFIAEIEWPDNTIEELSSNDYQWEYLPTNKNGYDNWQFFMDNN